MGWFLIALAVSGGGAWATQIQDLVRLKGSETSKLVGMGLVVGLPGTGDGGKFLPAMRALASVVGHFLDPNTQVIDLKDAKNVAVVVLTATVPASGVREGDRLDVYVSTYGPAKSLAGGRLFLVPMQGPLPGSPVYAYAEGAVTVEDVKSPTTGVVRGGAQLVKDVQGQYLDGAGQMCLVLEGANATWPTATNLMNLINGVMSPDGPNIARAVDPKNIMIQVPEGEVADPATFISQILQTYVDPSQISTGAKVVVNERTGTIVVSGDVQISPVIISHKGLTITALNPPVATAQNPQLEERRFVVVDPEDRGGARLADLLAAFNQLKVESGDRIAIVKEIHRSGKLHAQLIVE